MSPASISSSVNPASRRKSSVGASSTSMTTFSRCRLISSGSVSIASSTTAPNCFIDMRFMPSCYLRALRLASSPFARYSEYSDSVCRPRLPGLLERSRSWPRRAYSPARQRFTATARSTAVRRSTSAASARRSSAPAAGSSSRTCRRSSASSTAWRSSVWVSASRHPQRAGRQAGQGQAVREGQRLIASVGQASGLSRDEPTPCLFPSTKSARWRSSRRLELSDADLATMQQQLSAILDYVAQLNELDTDGVEELRPPAAGRERVPPGRAGPVPPGRCGAAERAEPRGRLLRRPGRLRHRRTRQPLNSRIEPQRHRDRQEDRTEFKSTLSLSSFSLCLCASVVSPLPDTQP